MLENRKYIILPISVLPQVDWNNLLTEEGQQRLSVDGTKFLVEYNLPLQPMVPGESEKIYISGKVR